LVGVEVVSAGGTGKARVWYGSDAGVTTTTTTTKMTMVLVLVLVLVLVQGVRSTW